MQMALARARVDEASDNLEIASIVQKKYYDARYR